MSIENRPQDAFRDGAAEVKEKLRSDLSSISNITRVRRFVSLAPTMVCPDCEGTRKVACGACGGEGKQKVVWNDEVIECEGCKGAMVLDCGHCFGRGRVKNIHRKKFLTLLGIGGLAWLFVLYRLWGGDVLPEQRSKYMAGGGGGGKARSQVSPRGGRGSMQPPNAPIQNPVSPEGGVQSPPQGAFTPAPDSGMNQGAPPTGIQSPRGGQMRPQGSALGGNQ